MAWLLQALVFVTCLGSSVGALVIVGDLTPSIIVRMAELTGDDDTLANTTLQSRQARPADPRL